MRALRVIFKRTRSTINTAVCSDRNACGDWLYRYLPSERALSLTELDLSDNGFDTSAQRLLHHAAAPLYARGEAAGPGFELR